MANLNQQIVSAVKILIRRNGGEFHGFWHDISDRIACEVGGNPDDYIVKQFENHLRTLGLKYFFEDHPDICFFRGASGDLNFVDRKLTYAVAECTVHTEPGYDPGLVWRELTHEQ